MGAGKYFFGCIFALVGAAGCVQPSFDTLASGFALRFGVPEVHTRDLAAFGPDLVIDVRSPAEQSVSLIPGAVLASPGQDLWLLPGFGSAKRILVYCAAGYRSARAISKIPAERLAGREVQNLHGGIVAYANAGLPLVSPVGTPTRKVHGYNEAWAKYVQKPAEVVIEPAAE